MQIRALFAMLIRQIEVRPDRVDLQLCPARLPTIVGIASAITGNADKEDVNVLILSVAAQLRRTGKDRCDFHGEWNYAIAPRPSPIQSKS